ncbi:MAG: FAD:protein FMN transferase [Thiohalobacteraceae bacterium]|nr:FAD:protein FMN transferase [Gammaproteobacteria bacterium]
MPTRRLSPYLLLLLGLATAGLLAQGCARQPDAVQEQQFIAFGTLVDVSVYGVDAELAQRAFTDLEQRFAQWHHDWHAWEPGPLVDLNTALETTGEAEVPAVILPLIAPAQDLSARSNGLFDPAIGGLLALWGFQSDAPPQAPPAAAAITAELAKRPRMSDLRLEDDRLITTNRAVKLDFGAFAKGVAVDRAIEHLRELGIDNAIVNAGGDLRAIGRRGTRAWRIGVRNPRGPGVLAVIEAQGDESIFTSGDYERGFDYQGRHYHHILDPRTGYPAAGARSVTVIYPDAATADAAATALLVAGAKDWLEVARNLQLRWVMLVDGEGVVHMTPAMAERVHIELDPPPLIELSEAP